MTTAIVLFGTLALLLIIGVPISISLGACHDAVYAYL